MPVNPEFFRRTGQIKEEIAKIPFIVLVWGPGEATDSAERKKRVKIREDLETLLGEQNVLFSEDNEMTELRQAGDFAAEYIEVRAADAVVVIPESPGSLTETALYTEELLGKTIVFRTKRRQNGFASQAYQPLKVEDIEPEEWEECDRVRRLAREFIETMRIRKFRKSKTVFDWE